ncbi:MAG: DUF2141 domain-containing protein [Salinarimonas sp.]|nr:DUF2141 domain-containing protein [Salinarimonas sp.]
MQVRISAPLQKAVRSTGISLIALTTLVGAGVASPAIAQSAETRTATVTVQVSDVESAEGQVYVGLCDRGFAEERCLDGRFQPAQPGTMRFTFENVPVGMYAVAAYHDINMNERMDTNIIGLPREPYGFSNDVGRRAPPNFSAAQVPVTAPSTTINVRMARMGGN